MNLINIFKFIVRLNHLSAPDLEKIGIPSTMSDRALQLIKKQNRID